MGKKPPLAFILSPGFKLFQTGFHSAKHTKQRLYQWRNKLFLKDFDD
jgi:hypothetical protein